LNETGSTRVTNIPGACNLSIADVTSWIIHWCVCRSTIWRM